MYVICTHMLYVDAFVILQEQCVGVHLCLFLWHREYVFASQRRNNQMGRRPCDGCDQPLLDPAASSK